MGAFAHLDRSDGVLFRAVCWVRARLLCSAPGQGVSRPPHTASRDCRTAHPLPVRSRVRLHRNAGSRGKRKKSGQKAGKTMQPRSQRSPAFLSAPLHAAQRAVTGWRGGLGRVGADLASAGSMRHPPSPARHVSTAWLATTHASQETARHHQSQARNGTRPNTPAEKRTTTKKTSRERNQSPGIRRHRQKTERCRTI